MERVTGLSEDKIRLFCQLYEAEIEESSIEASLALTPVDLSQFSTVTQNVLVSWKLTTLGVLQLLSTTELSGMEPLGKVRIRQLRQYLEAQDPPLRPRKHKVPFAERADRVYGSLNRVPTSVLACLHLNMPSEAEAWAAAWEAQGWLTIGDLREVTADSLRRYLPDFSYGGVSRVGALIDWLCEHDILPPSSSAI